MIDLGNLARRYRLKFSADGRSLRYRLGRVVPWPHGDDQLAFTSEVEADYRRLQRHGWLLYVARGKATLVFPVHWLGDVLNVLDTISEAQEAAA